MLIPLIGSSTEGISTDADAQESTNMYIEPAAAGGRPALVRFPGLRQVSTVPGIFSTLEADWESSQGFFLPYEAPPGVTFTLTSQHPTGQRTPASETTAVTGVLTGLSSDPNSDLYFDNYVIGIYNYADEYFSAIISGIRQYYQITAAEQAAGTFSIATRLFPGVKIIRLERKIGTYPIVAFTLSPQPNQATFSIAGRQGVDLIQGADQVVADTNYWVVATIGVITYNGVDYANNASVTGVADVTDFTATGDAVLRRAFQFYDWVWVRSSAVTARDGIYRVLSSRYDTGTARTIITLRDIQNVSSTGGSLAFVQPVGESYNDRRSSRSYAVDRVRATQLFNIIGYRAFTYDADALLLIAATAQEDESIADDVIDTMEKKVYPLVDGGSTWSQIGGDGLNSGWGTDKETVYSLATWRDELYAGLGDGPGDSEVWRLRDGAWSQVGGDGLNSSWSALGVREGVKAMTVYRDQLYAGIGATGWAATGNHAEVWRWDGSSWTEIGNTSTWGTDKQRVTALAVHNQRLYAALGWGGSTGDIEIWAYDGTAWEQVAGDTINNSWNTPGFDEIVSLHSHHGRLYAGMGWGPSDSALWAYDNTAWREVAGGPSGLEFSSMATYGGLLYLGVALSTGGELWTYNAETEIWAEVTALDFSQRFVTGLHVFGDELYIGTGRHDASNFTQVWSFDGAFWQQIAGDGVSPGWNATSERVWTSTIHNRQFMVGLGSDIDAGAGVSGHADLWSQTLLSRDAHDAGNFAFSYYVHGYNASRQRGSDLVLNGGFTSVDNWVFGTGFSRLSSNVARKVASVGFGRLSQTTVPGLLVENEEYFISGTVSNFTAGSGGFTPYVGGTGHFASITTNGRFSVKIMAGPANEIRFDASAGAVFELTDVVVRRADEKILAPDPYFRNGASLWNAKAYGYYLQKYPESARAPIARARLRALLDHIIDAYLVRAPNHPQRWLVRGGLGNYDTFDPGYVWHPNEQILWCSTEHNIDFFWALNYAADAGLISDSRRLAEEGLTYRSLQLLLKAKVKTDVTDNGLYLTAKRRYAQGIAAEKVVQVDATNRQFHINTIQTPLLTVGFVFDVRESTDVRNDGTYTVVSSVPSSTVIASGSIQDDRYYRVVGTGDPVIEYDNTQYGVGQVSSIFSGRNGITTFTVIQGTPVVSPHETVITVAEPVAQSVPHTIGPARVGAAIWPDQAAALDLTSWMIPLLVEIGEKEIAETIEPFLNSYLVTDETYQNVRGYKPYLRCIPDRELYPGQTIDDQGCMQPWSDIGYPAATDAVWYEGTGGVMLAYGALSNWGRYNSTFEGALPGREIVEGGYPYTTTANQPYELTNSVSAASTHTMVIAQRPNNFWGVNLPGNVPGRSAEVGVRGLHVMDGALFAVMGNLVFRFDEQFNPMAINTEALNTSAGPVQMADNGTQLMISDGTTQAYLWDQATLTWTILNENNGFLAGGSAAQIDSIFISHSPTTQAIYWSDVNDGTSWNPLDTSSAYVQSGDIVALEVDHREVWVFKTETTEIFYNSGDAELTFVRLSAGVLEHGCAAQHSVVKIDNSVFWLAHDLTLRRAQGITPQIVSTTHVVAQWREYTRVDDAVAFGYVDQGHTFYQITFPSAGTTWIYDMRTNTWSQRSSYTEIDGAQGPHRSRSYVRFRDRNIMGDYERGHIYVLDPNTHTDNGEPIVWSRTLPTIVQERKPFFVRRLEIEMETAGLSAGPGSQPQFQARISRDFGHTWGSLKKVEMGKAGEYSHRSVLRRLGRARAWTLEVSGSEPIKTVITSAQAEIERGDR